jgi:GNAT superfamily N-acetyltransferase
VRIGDLANDHDVEQLSQLRFSWRAKERDEQGLSEDEFARSFARWCREHSDSHVGFLGSLGDNAVAMTWLALVDRVPGPRVFERRCAYVQSAYVSPEHRNAGYGSRLMAGLIDYSRTLGLDYVAVHPSSESFSFYQRLGFAGTSKVLELDFRHERS